MPVDSTSTKIQPGEWVSVYGTNLATTTATWNGNFPVSLGGASVTVNGKSAYLWYASPGQINLQAPDDSTTGSVSVVVTTGAGSATSSVTLGPVAPSFLLLDGRHVTGIILRSNGAGAYAGGTYDILGPTGNSLGYATVAAKAGDSVVLFGVGFGPTTPAVPAGQVFSGAAQTTNMVSLLIKGVSGPDHVFRIVERRPLPDQSHRSFRPRHGRRFAAGHGGRLNDTIRRLDFTAVTGLMLEKSVPWLPRKSPSSKPAWEALLHVHLIDGTYELFRYYYAVPSARGPRRA